MIPTVLDANVITSGIAGSDNPNSVPAELLRLADQRRYRLILSEFLVDEVERAFQKPYFRRRFPPELVTRALGVIRLLADMVEPDSAVAGVAPDPSDDPVLGTAVAGGTDYLVTGDTRLRSLRTYRAIAIVSPAEFLAFLQAVR